jgi:hypothetical protein
METFIKSNYRGEFIGKITRSFDSYINPRCRSIYQYTYLLPLNKNLYYIRCYDTTVGRILTDDNDRINIIDLYPCAYKVYTTNIILGITKDYIRSKLTRVNSD